MASVSSERRIVPTSYGRDGRVSPLRPSLSSKRRERWRVVRERRRGVLESRMDQRFFWGIRAQRFGLVIE